MSDAAASPRATRLAVPRWLDARLVVGVLLVLLSVVAGARLVGSADHLTNVYVARHDLVPGERLTTGDLAVARARLADDGSSYVAAASAPPVGYVVTRFVGAHELLPAAAVSAGGPANDARYVTVPVQEGHLPADLGRGDLVDVYLTPKVAAGAPVPAPRLVIARVPVDTREGGARGFGAAASALAVVLTVPAAQVPDVVQAVESGTLDLVRVPPAVAASTSAAGTSR